MNLFIQLTSLALLMTTPALAQFGDCIDAAGNVNCAFLEQGLVALSAKREEMKKRYQDPNARKDQKVFEAEFHEFLDIFNKLQVCPNAPTGCPSFSFKKNFSESLVMSVDYSAYGSPCRPAKRPMTMFYNKKGEFVLNHVGDNIQLKVEAQCSPTEKMTFVAYKEGLLVGSSSDKMRFESQAVGRRITLGKSALEIRPQGENVRIVWKGASKESWIEMDPKTKIFTDSNFMKVDQLNPGKCKVEKFTQPQGICDKNRKALIHHKGIKKPSEYECQEYVPVIEGVPSTITRG